MDANEQKGTKGKKNQITLMGNVKAYLEVYGSSATA